jgi:hypothetical protein
LCYLELLKLIDLDFISFRLPKKKRHGLQRCATPFSWHIWCANDRMWTSVPPHTPHPHSAHYFVTALCLRIFKKKSARLFQRSCTGLLAAGSAPAPHPWLLVRPIPGCSAVHATILCGASIHLAPARKRRHAPAAPSPSTSHVGRNGRPAPVCRCILGC